MRALKRVVLLKPGVARSRELLGDYEQWFLHGLGGHATLHKVELHAGERPPSLAGFDGVLMTGSPLSVTTPEPWMDEAAALMLEAAARGVPVLGVCFGLQLLARALGGAVARNPAGLEVGTVTLSRTEVADPLFDGVPGSFAAQVTHEDAVLTVPPGALVLARSERCAVHAFAHGPRVRAVQFHPEMTGAAMRATLALTTGLDEAERARLHDEAHDTPWGYRVLQNWVTRFG